MRIIDKPNIRIKDIFEKHKNHFQNKIKEKNKINDASELSSKLDEVKNYFIDKELKYDKLAKNNNLAKIEKKCSSIDFDIKESYKYIFSKERDIRSEITKLAMGRCPICDTSFGYGMLQLDHVLPKSSYIDYAITPINLIPICSGCNLGKSNKINYNFGVLTPYYNQYPLEDILEFIINIENKEIKPSVSIIDCDKFKGKRDIYDKIKNHFELHKVDETLTMKASVVLNDIISSLANMNSMDVKSDIIETQLCQFKNTQNQSYINEEYIKTNLIDAIIAHKEKENLYSILIDRINDGRNHNSQNKVYNV